MQRILPSSIISRIVLLCLFLVFLSVAALGSLAYLNLRNDVMTSALSEASKSMRTLGLIYEREVPGARIELNDGKVAKVIGGNAEFKDHDIVDRTAASIGGVATIFEKRGSDYVRVSTNVKTEKGERAVGTKLAADHPAQAVLAKGEAYFGAAFLFGKDYMTGYFPITDAQGAVTGVLFIGVPMQVYFDHISASANIMLVTSLAALLVMGIISVFAVRALIRPLGILTGTVRAISEGDSKSDIPYLGLANEFGNIARALEVFRNNALEKLAIERRAAEERESAENERQHNDAQKQIVASQIDEAVRALGAALSRLSQGDLSTTIEAPFSGDMDSLRNDFNGSIVKLRDALSNIRSSTLSIQKSSADLSHSSAELSRRTESQAASLEETAAAVDEITVTVRSSAERAREADHAVSQTKKNAENSGTVVRNAVAAMGRIEEASQKIELIIDVIDDIAFQTNLLALNAGIEAARAGEAGKGFAVVAQEVRELAQRSAGAAKEIKDLINQSSHEVNAGASLVQQAGEALATIGSEIASISKHVETIATGSQDQSAALQEINGSVNKMDQMTQANGAMVSETSEASHRLAADAEALLGLVDRFRIDRDGRPVRAVRAA